LGQDTDNILGGLLGYSDEKIRQLRGAAVIK
jgi:crotonobetainyl-CoA:carnitine CoA-transferase CaiB-like acyl-CoA transferase